jgi:hypothetical protein
VHRVTIQIRDDTLIENLLALLGYTSPPGDLRLFRRIYACRHLFSVCFPPDIARSRR